MLYDLAREGEVGSGEGERNIDKNRQTEKKGKGEGEAQNEFFYASGRGKDAALMKGGGKEDTPR